MSDRTFFYSILVLGLFLLATAIYSGDIKASSAPVGSTIDLDTPPTKLKYNFNSVLFSKHHSGTGPYNENHYGFGLSVSVPDSYTYGIMRFKNSYSDMATLIYLGSEYGCLYQICGGVGMGIVNGYKDHLKIPVAGWLTFRYKYIVVTTIPTSVTTIGFTVPLN